MELKELKLNRYMYRSEPDPVQENAIFMSANINSKADIGKKDDRSIKNAKEVITGTVITACLFKSSDGDDRVEIGQNLEFVGGTTDVDYLAVYNGAGGLSILMTKFGMTVVTSVLIQGRLDVLDLIRYAGEDGGPLINQPIQYWFRLEGAEIRNNFNNAWTVTKTGTGEYTVTHNLGHDYYAVNVTISSDVGWLAGGFAATSFVGDNSFVIDTFDDTGTPQDSDWSCMVSVSPNAPTI